jgi:hypothetical protein
VSFTQSTPKRGVARPRSARPHPSAWRTPGISAIMNAIGAAVPARPSLAGRCLRIQGRERFLILGGHRRGFALTSLAYFRCSGPPLENTIRK